MNQEQANEDSDRNGDDERLKAGVDDGQALHRRQDGNGRGDHGVAVEQAGRQHAHREQACRPFPAGQVARDERQKGKRAAFAAIVGAHRHRDIFDRDDQHQRPEDQAQHAKDVQPVDRQWMRANEAFLHRVKRRGADIAVHDADRAEHENG